MNNFLIWFMDTIGQHISREFAVFLVSLLPLIEERGGLVLARFLELPLWRALIFCIIGNMVPVPFILHYIKALLHWMADHNMHGIVAKCEAKVEKNRDKIEKYGTYGLILFVGIPLPGTGAWSGSLVASLLNLDTKKASVAIFLGVLLAAIIMSFLSYGVIGSLI